MQVQALIVLIGCGLAYTHPDRAKDDIAMWTHNMILIYTKDYIDDILTSIFYSFYIVLYRLCTHGTLLHTTNTYLCPKTVTYKP